MTRAQLREAKTGQAEAWMFARVVEDRKGCVGVEDEDAVVGRMESLARASMTRAKT